MVSKNLLTLVSQRLNQIIRPSCKNATFGNIGVIAVGDFHQLPPVFGASLLQFDVGALPPDLWPSFQLTELEEIMRQKNDKPFADLLLRLRLKQKNEDLLPQDFNTLKKRTIEHHPNYPKECLHIFGTNAQVNDHNSKMLDTLETQQVELDACDMILTPESKQLICKNKIKYKHNNNPNLPDKLVVAEGARIMLINNLDVQDGLVNGVMGTVSKISSETTSYNLPKYIFVIFDNENVGQKARSQQHQHSSRDIQPNATPIYPKTSHVINQGLKSYVRIQFPLKLAWAVTIHKMQGLTVSKALVVDMKNIFREGMAYVALSRTTKLENLFIQHLEQQKIYTKDTTSTSLAQMQRLAFEKLPNQSNHIGIIHHNTQSLKAHFAAFCTNIVPKNFDVICLSETWLINSDYSALQIPNYDFFATHPQHKRGGGVAVYISNKIEHYKIISTQSNDAIETMCIKIVCEATPLILCVVYRHPNGPKKRLCNLPQDLIEQMHAEHASTIIVVGDFNENLFTSNPIICSYFQQRNFQQHASEATTQNDTLLDHIYTYNAHSCHVGKLSTFYSYHDPNYISICKSIPCNDIANSTGKCIHL